LRVNGLLQVLDGRLQGVELLHHLQFFFIDTEGGPDLRAQEGQDDQSQ
jgi:hypothetical protein